MELEKQSTNNIVKSINKWKIAFIILVGIILGLFIFLFIRINAEREPNLPVVLDEIKQSESSFQVELNKSQANAIVNDFLTDFQKDSSIKYDFILEKQALLIGNFVFLDEKVKFYLYFTPSLENNGDVMLKATSVSIGELGLPKSELLQYVQNNYEVPDWVEVRASENSIILHLSQFETAGGMRITANEIDLIDDEIIFTVSLS